MKLNEIIGREENTINIWADWWLWNPEIVQSRIYSKLGLLTKLPGRVCTVKRISKPIADKFLAENHLQGFTTSKLKYGLFLPEKYFRLFPYKPADEKEILLAVMTFSSGRTFNDGTRSYELLRFCVLRNFHVQGAFSKLFNFFIKEVEPSSVMTYLDLDWQTENNYEKAGFEQCGILEPMKFKVDSTGKRHKVTKGFDVINSGSLKLLWRK